MLTVCCAQDDAAVEPDFDAKLFRQALRPILEEYFVSSALDELMECVSRHDSPQIAHHR